MKQEQLFNPDNVNSHQFSPVTSVRDSAASYTKRTTGNEWKDVSPSLQADSIRGRAQYEEYRKAQNAPKEASGIRESYAHMRDHTVKQYSFLTSPEKEGGMGFTHEVTSEDPYSSSAEMARDVARKHIKTFSTASTGGHEYFSDDENDKFRAVHDVFGHAGIGRGFSRHGEEAAFQTHRQMFPPEAHAALASETRGQNSYLNYGGEGFPDQGPGSKLVGLPKWAQTDGPVPAARVKSRTKKRGEQLRLF